MYRYALSGARQHDSGSQAVRTRSNYYRPRCFVKSHPQVILK
jgi:hypothetical protein